MADILDVISSRKSIRRYTTDPIPQEMILRILEAGRWAPTGENYQPWKILVVKNPETRAAIARLAKIGTGSRGTAEYSMNLLQRFDGMRPEDKERALKFYATGEVSLNELWQALQADFAGHEPLQFGLALDQRLVSQVTAIEMKEIEDVIDEAFALARLERRLQPGKTGNAARILHHHLTVNERGVRRELGDGGRDIGKFARPIQALAREQLDLTAVKPGLDPVLRGHAEHPLRTRPKQVLSGRRGHVEESLGAIGEHIARQLPPFRQPILEVDSAAPAPLPTAKRAEGDWEGAGG